MKSVHFTLQGKGGVGKSFVSSLLAQFYKARAEPIMCIDTDPVNATLLGYRSLNAQRIDLMDGSTLNERKFDEMMETILSQDSTIVVDNGAASFIPLSNYMVENHAISMIQDAGKHVVIHTVITGGQAMLDTLRGFKDLVTQLPKGTKIIVWLNEYFGEIKSHDGKTFEEMKVYTEHRDAITGIVRIPRQTSATFGMDVELMLDKKLTFDDVAQSAEFGVMAKQRLTTVRRRIFEQMEVAM